MVLKMARANSVETSSATERERGAGRAHVFGAVALEHDLAGALVVHLLVHAHVEDVAALVGEEEADRDPLPGARQPAAMKRRACHSVSSGSSRHESTMDLSLLDAFNWTNHSDHAVGQGRIGGRTRNATRGGPPLPGTTRT